MKLFRVRLLPIDVTDIYKSGAFENCKKVLIESENIKAACQKAVENNPGFNWFDAFEAFEPIKKRRQLNEVN